MDGTHTGKLSAESVRAALRRVRGSALNFVPRDCEAEARPADETAEAEQGQRSAFCKPAATGAAKAGNRNHQGEGISVPRMRAEMGSPWSVSQKRHAKKPPRFTPQGFRLREAGIYLFSQAVSSQLSSAQVSLTSVFGMGTGGASPSSTPAVQALHFTATVSCIS